MNKKFLRVALLIAVVAVAGLGAHKAQAKKPVLSDIMLANVEALSYKEDFVITCNQYDYISPGQCWTDDGDCVRLGHYYRACKFVGDMGLFCTSICNL